MSCLWMTSVCKNSFNLTRLTSWRQIPERLYTLTHEMLNSGKNCISCVVVSSLLFKSTLFFMNGGSVLLLFHFSKKVLTFSFLMPFCGLRGFLVSVIISVQTEQIALKSSRDFQELILLFLISKSQMCLQRVATPHWSRSSSSSL